MNYDEYALDKSEKYNVKIDNFEGPLDLLLHLVKTSEISIYDIKISEITQQYLKYLSFLIAINLDGISEFVDFATMLVLLKSRAMLPIEVNVEEDTEEEPRKELINKLLEYQKYKMAANLLEVMSEETLPLIKRQPDVPALFELNNSEDLNWKQLSILDLIGAFAEILNKSNHLNNKEMEVVIYTFTVEDKIKEILNILESKDNFNYFSLLRDDMTKIEIICTFLALLELVKKGIISVRQHKIFGDIHIFKKQNENK